MVTINEMLNTAKVNIMKNRWLLLTLTIILCGFVDAHIDSCQGTDYLQNPQRTGYSVCTGPDSPIELWKAEFPGDFDTSPFIVDDKVLIVWKNSRVHLWETKVVLLDLITGRIFKEVRSDDFIFKAFPIGQQILGIASEKVYEINFDSGEVSFLAPIPEKSFVMTNMYPLVLEDRIIIPTTPVVCLSRSDFHLLWNLKDTISDCELRPVSLAGDETLAVFVMATDDGYRIFAVNPSTGSLKWKSDLLPAAHWLALGEKTIYCARERLWAFDRKGSALWEFVPEEKIVSNIVVGPNALYIADAANKLYRIDFDGNLVWKTEWEVSLWNRETHLFGAGDILYCIANFGDFGSQLSAFDMGDGRRIWDFEFETPEWIKGSPLALIKGFPAVGNGILVIGKIGGEITALASDPDIFVRQGDAFFSEGYTEKAINSYKKAAELYEQKGDLTRSEEIEKQIDKLEPPSKSPPETTPPPTPPTTSPPAPPSNQPETPPESTSPPQEPLTLIPLTAVVLIGAVIGVFVTYYIISGKKTQK